MVHEFKLTVVHVHAQTRCRSVHERGFNAEQKTVENPGLGLGPPCQAYGLWAAVGCESDSELNSECTIHSRLTLN